MCHPSGSAPRPAGNPIPYQNSVNLPEILHRLGCSLVVSTYQAGKLVTVGSHAGELVFGLASFNKPMGVARTPSGLVVGGMAEVWTLPGYTGIAARLPPEGTHDIAFLTRSAHLTGAVLGHELAWGKQGLWLVNTLFSCLCTLEDPWSFRPRWQPPFISSLEQGDRCHLNGLAMDPQQGTPAYVTALGESDEPGGWRQRKAEGGCLIAVDSGEVVLRGLSMPHSPRLHQGRLYLLDSGHGRLVVCDPAAGRIDTICELPGFTRGLDLFGDFAAVGVSKIREKEVFGDLPISRSDTPLRCGVAIVHLPSARVVAQLWFNAGVDEIFACTLLPGHRNPIVVGPHDAMDQQEPIWIVPPDTTLEVEF
ncbi:TIGR03032 family protein [Cyanobium gracile UHCC 0139]|uniref:TIGR03032 family protein n=1 Tax=Cyanobium gracile UHCC 0139 TaxID=3110308 RepID=A0ABU5RWW9_9CYAN|nr:TIGR03032 family protein [Cyanobium gracile]MEA5392272.1 TIGR03032 family protein [Cyanobium gracile UHCC 0139]